MEINTITVIRLKGRMDALSAQTFEQRLHPLEGSQQVVVVDLETLEYISSAGLRSILTATKRMQAAGGQIRFCNAKGLVNEIFRSANLASVMPFYKTWKEALA